MKTIRAFAAFIGLAVLATTSMSATAERPIRMDPRGNPVPSTAASFDCSKAQGFVETSICSDGSLALSDRSIDETYRRLLLHASAQGQLAVRQEQRDWLHERNACDQQGCLEVSLDARQRALRAELDRLDRALRANINQVGQCEATRIDFIGTRLAPVEGERLDGTSVGFADGVWQVSYDREPGVLRSRLGDSVRVCLVSKPRNCPPGDDRGQVYAVENLRTHARWKLRDDSHSCGGA
jgi:uncharacterized protein YecT (DUF1311 family)